MPGGSGRRRKSPILTDRGFDRGLTRWILASVAVHVLVLGALFLAGDLDLRPRPEPTYAAGLVGQIPAGLEERLPTLDAGAPRVAAAAPARPRAVAEPPPGAGSYDRPTAETRESADVVLPAPPRASPGGLDLATPTPVSRATAAPTPSPTAASPTSAPSATSPTPAPSATSPTPAPSATSPTPSPSATPVPTASPTATPPAPTASPTATPAPTASPTATPAPTFTPRPTRTARPAPAAKPARPSATGTDQTRPAAPTPGPTRAPAVRPTPVFPPGRSTPIAAPKTRAPGEGRPTPSLDSSQRPEDPDEAVAEQPAPARSGGDRDARIAAALDRVRSRVAEPSDVSGGRVPGVPGGSPAGRPGGLGAGAADGLRGSDFLSYYEQMIARVRDAWIWGGGGGDLEVEVAFGITAAGEIVDIRVLRPSGDASYDRSVLRALHTVQNLGPPPERHRETFSRVELTFRPADLERSP